MTKQIVITPTIGRRIWYVPSTYDRGGCTTKPPTIIEGSSSHPCDAGVVFVHNDRLVNLSVTDHNGNVHKRTSVTLYQPGDTITHADGGYAVWMDYQAQQATPKPQPSTTAKYFSFDHLPAHLQIVSKPLGQLAELLEQLLPAGPEKSAGMRKLLEAKDCFVRAALDLQPAELLARAPITDSDRLDLVLRAGLDTRVEKLLVNSLVDSIGDADPTQANVLAALDEVIKQERAPQLHTEEPDHPQD